MDSTKQLYNDEAIVRSASLCTQLTTCNILHRQLAAFLGLSCPSDRCLPELSSQRTAEITKHFPLSFHKSLSSRSDAPSVGCCLYFLKSQPVYEFWLHRFREELLLLSRLNGQRISPHFYGGWFCPQSGRGYQIQQAINGQTLGALLQHQPQYVSMELLRRIVDKIRQLNKRFQVKHGDLHLNNILIDNNGEPWIIDYGQAEFLSPVNSNSNTSDGDEDVTMFLEELREFKSQLPVVAEFIAHKL